MPLSCNSTASCSLLSLSLAALLGAGCLEPAVSDVPGSSVNILPAGSAVPHVSANADLTRQIRVGDGLNDQALEDAGGLVKLKDGFAAGAAVKYWDFGAVPDTGGLLFRLVQKDGDTITPINHPLIANAIPGDAGYSPLWMIQDVVVTEHYHGEVLTSLVALTDAVDLGLVEDPMPAMLWMDGPIVAYGTKLDMGPDVAPGGTTIVYAHGYGVDMFMLGGARALRTQAKAGKLPKGDAHALLVGNAVNPLKTPLFQNAATPWTPAVRIVNCRVTPADPNDPTTIIEDEAQLFSRDMMGALMAATSRVISWSFATGSKNWPILETP
jgi:hypothetical protein